MVSMYHTMTVVGGVSGNIKAISRGINVNLDDGQLPAVEVVPMV